jgi:hypothetical protein
MLCTVGSVTDSVIIYITNKEIGHYLTITVDKTSFECRIFLEKSIVTELVVSKFPVLDLKLSQTL